MTSILVADDDASFRQLIRRILGPRGYDVVEAGDGQAVLEHLARAADGHCAEPDVVLLDVLMPGCSGLGVLEVLHRFAKPPPTVLVTGFRDPSIGILARRFGARRVMHKPVQVDDVIGVVLDVTTPRE